MVEHSINTWAASSPVGQLDVQQQTLVYRHASGMDVTLDLYTPQPGGAANHPAIVFFFGGGWRMGSPKLFEPQARAFAAHGYVAASAEYRLLGTAPFPAAVTDAKASVRWLRSHASEYGIDPDRILVGGGSSGGHLAALVATTPGTWEEGENLDETSAVQGALLLNPVTDLRDGGMSEGVQTNLVEWLGGSSDEIPALYADGSPLVHVSTTTPPTLLLHGTGDVTVPFQQSVTYGNAIKAAGGTAELFTAAGAVHAFFNGPPWNELTLTAMMDFADRVVGAPGAVLRHWGREGRLPRGWSST